MATVSLWGIAFDFHYSLLLGLAGVGAVDIFLRWFAFGRIESIGLDAAIFTFLYSLVEWIRLGHTQSDNWWGVKTLVGLFCVVLFAAVHGVAYRTQLREDRLRNFTDRMTDVVDPSTREAARKLGQLLERTIPLTIDWRDKGVRRGKLRLRQEAAELVNGILPRLGATPQDVENLAVSEESFILPPWKRRWFGLAFFILGGIALIAPTVSPAPATRQHPQALTHLLPGRESVRLSVIG